MGQPLLNLHRLALCSALDNIFDGNNASDLTAFSGASLTACEKMYAAYQRMEKLTDRELRTLLQEALDGNRPQHLESYTGLSLAQCDDIYKLAFPQQEEL